MLLKLQCAVSDTLVIIAEDCLQTNKFSLKKKKKKSPNSFLGVSLNWLSYFPTLFLEANQQYTLRISPLSDPYIADLEVSIYELLSNQVCLVRRI